MWPNLQFPADLVTFTEEIFNGKFHFLCSESFKKRYQMDSNNTGLSLSNNIPTKVILENSCVTSPISFINP